MRNVSYCFFNSVLHVSEHSNAQMSVYPHNFNNLLNFSRSASSDKSIGTFIIFNHFLNFRKSFVPLKNTSTRQSIVNSSTIKLTMIAVLMNRSVLFNKAQKQTKGGRKMKRRIKDNNISLSTSPM